MTLKTFDYFRWSITFILMLFHCLVSYFIFAMRFRKNKTYMSPFFLLYLMVSFADIGTIINTFLVSKFVYIEAWKPFFVGHQGVHTVLWLISGYLIYSQGILHSAIAINRCWVSFSLTTANSKMAKLGRRLIWVLPFLPLTILSVRFWGTLSTVFLPNGDITSFYVEPFIKNYHALAGATVAFTTSTISFTLTLLTIVRYRHLFKIHQHMSATTKQDVILFCQAAVTFCLVLAYIPYYILLRIGSSTDNLSLVNFSLTYFNYINDVASLTNPITLLLVCKFIRKDFIQFLPFPKSSTVSPWHSS